MKNKLMWVVALGFSSSAFAIPEGPDANTPAWFQREAMNYARTLDAPTEQLSPDFQQRLITQDVANETEWLMRGIADTSWFSPTSGNTNFTPLCTSWMWQCAGDPFRYPGVDPFYETDGEVTPFVYYDEGCARISGRVWAPKGSAAGAGLPAVVIETGSIQAPETLYWWYAQALVRQGYVAMTFDVRGQGRSDQQTPTGEQGSNANSEVFFGGLVNAIDFFRSTPAMTYPHNATCAGTYPTAVTDFNPYFDRIDPARLGIAGHSLGAGGVSAVQGYDPWPGKLDAQNPVKAVVAWDSLNASSAGKARVPAMGQTSEYGIGGGPKQQPPDPEGHKAGYALWKSAGVPVYQLTIQGSTHFEWSLIPTFPATSWCPTVGANGCEGGWGRPLAEHYSVAWMDRWLKNPGEKGYDDADARLLADADWCERYSFYSRAARSFATREGALQNSEDIRADCLAKAAGTMTAPAASAAKSTSGGKGLFLGALNPALLFAFGAMALRRRRRA